MALMASFTANAPLRIVGSRLDPARGPVPPAQAQSAPLACPVLLVHGFCGTKSSWSLVARSLKAQGLTVDAISYAPFGISVEQVADRLVAKVHSMLFETGADKVYLVGHSLGGVIIAQAIAAGHLNGLVDTVITLGSPFGGSPLAKLLPFMELPRALQKGSQLLRGLASAPAPDGCDGWHSRPHSTFSAGHEIGASSRKGGNHNGRRRRPPRNAPESASRRTHSPRPGRMMERDDGTGRS